MNTFGNIFRVSVFGESHGSGIGVTIDGCPAGLRLSPGDFVADLSRRKSGKTGTTSRHEDDLPEIISGVYNGFTSGSPITIYTRNSDKISSDYDSLKGIPRPGHADFTAGIKYSGFADMRGSGHFSGRITWGIVVAGVIARVIIKPAVVSATLLSAGGDSNIDEAVAKAVSEGDSIGGVIECTVSNPAKALGEPFFNSCESVISHIVFSIPAIRGIEFGAGFASASMRGSEHNDPIIDAEGKTSTNNAGGINGGITNGNDIVFRVAVKPTSSIKTTQRTFDFEKNEMTLLQVKGRHDSCIALRMPVIIESAAAIALADLFLTDRGINGLPRS
jgi:chorismate synthase